MSLTSLTSTSQNRVREILSYNPHTGLFHWKISTSNRAPIGSLAGSGPRSDGYWRIRIDTQLYAAHRLAWLYITGKWPPADIDHIDGDRLNNRISNLRLATRAQNLANSAPRAGTVSGRKGVSWSKARRKWLVQFQHNRKGHYLGYFTDLEEAAKAYESAVMAVNGKFARVS